MKPFFKASILFSLFIIISFSFLFKLFLVAFLLETNLPFESLNACLSISNTFLTQSNFLKLLSLCHLLIGKTIFSHLLVKNRFATTILTQDGTFYCYISQNIFMSKLSFPRMMLRSTYFSWAFTEEKKSPRFIGWRSCV